MRINRPLAALASGALATALLIPGSPDLPGSSATTVQTVTASAAEGGLTILAPVVPAVPTAAPARHGRPGPLVTHRSRGRGKAAVVLTFDDGPSPTFTPQVLALLRRQHVKAVFCLIGDEARRYPELVKAIADQGHELCNHTMQHDLRLSRRAPGVIEHDLAQTSAVIARGAGRPPTWFRAPGGGFTHTVDEIARDRGMRPLSWSDDPRDWSGIPRGLILGRVLRDVRPGGIILMHDGGGDRSPSVAALATLLRELPRRGYRFALPDGP